jgi:hypothetical protein
LVHRPDPLLEPDVRLGDDDDLDVPLEDRDGVDPLRELPEERDGEEDDLEAGRAASPERTCCKTEWIPLAWAFVMIRTVCSLRESIILTRVSTSLNNWSGAVTINELLASWTATVNLGSTALFD